MADLYTWIMVTASVAGIMIILAFLAIMIGGYSAIREMRSRKNES